MLVWRSTIPARGVHHVFSYDECLCGAHASSKSLPPSRHRPSRPRPDEFQRASQHQLSAATTADVIYFMNGDEAQNQRDMSGRALASNFACRFKVCTSHTSPSSGAGILSTRVLHPGSFLGRTPLKGGERSADNSGFA